MTLLIVGVAVLSAYLVGLVRWWAIRHQVLDIPNHRSSHTVPTPRGGGLAIVLITLGGMAVLAIWEPRLQTSPLLAYLAGGLLIAGLSWMDDLRPLPSALRFLNQAVAALLILVFCGSIQEVRLPFLGIVDLDWLGFVLSFLWIVGLTNAFNFMDGIDGIAGAQAVVAGASWLMIGFFLDLPAVAFVALLVTGSSLGFLYHNWAPARVFMGDVGSAFLGFSFAVIPILALRADPGLLVSGTLVVGLFVFDTSLTFLSRLMRGERVFSAHRSHLYQRLVRLGSSHAAVSLMYAALAAVLTLAAIYWTFVESLWAQVLLLLGAGLILPGLWIGVCYLERRRYLQDVPYRHSKDGPVILLGRD